MGEGGDRNSVVKISVTEKKGPQSWLNLNINFPSKMHFKSSGTDKYDYYD